MALAGWLATGGDTTFPEEVPAGLRFLHGRPALDPAARSTAVVIGHGWGEPDDAGPPVAVLQVSERGSTLVPLGDQDRGAAVVSIGAPASRLHHGGTFVDAA